MKTGKPEKVDWYVDKDILKINLKGIKIYNETGSATAKNLVFHGKYQPSGYTEPLLHFNRLMKKSI